MEYHQNIFAGDCHHLGQSPNETWHHWDNETSISPLSMAKAIQDW
jgi:hypothetical protein